MEHEPLLTWRARTRPKHERSALWYILAITFVLLMILYGLKSDSWGLVILMIMSTCVYYFLSLRPEPTVKTIYLLEEGVQLDVEFFPWKTLLGFWFQRYPEYTQLHIEHKEAWRYDLIIQTGAVSMANIRQVLSRQLPEHSDRTERVLDKISRICKI